MSWLKKKLFRKKISIAVIGVGNAGCRIGDKLIHSLRESRITVKSLAINHTDNFSPKVNNFSDHYWFGSKNVSSSNYEFDEAYKELSRNEFQLRDHIDKVLFYKKQDKRDEENPALHLIVGSGGGTGSAGSMKVSKIIAELTGTAPTVIFVIPEKNEPSLVQYNSARALYYLGFDYQGPNSPILLFDNDKLLNLFKEKTVEVALEKSNIFLAESLTTTILAALQESTHEEFHADLSDFFNSFTEEARGLGVIISLDREFETLEKAQSIRFSDLFFNELDESSSLTADITRAKLGFLTITSPTTYQSTFETRKIVKKFERGNIKASLNSIDEPILTIRGVLTGIHPDYVERFWEVLEKGRDSRKEILETEERIRQAYLQIE